MMTSLQRLFPAARTLLRRPRFTVPAILTLAVGLGAATAVFTLLDVTLLRPLPYPDSQRLVGFWGQGSWSKVELDFLRERPKSYEAVGAYAMAEVPYQGEEPRVLALAETSYDLFHVLDVDAALGRTFLPVEETPGNHQVVLLSDKFWRHEMGGDPEAVGQTLDLVGSIYEVVGVMPPDFEFPHSGAAELWVPMAIDRTHRSYFGSHYLNMVARLRDEVSVGAAREEIKALVPALTEAADLEPGFDKLAETATVEPLLHQTTRSSRMPIFMLAAASGLLLLLACANVAHLLLAQAVRREREMAIRGALGAGRGSLIVQLLAEAASLALTAGTLGLLLSVWAVDLLRSLLPSGTPRLEELTMDGRVFAFGAVATLATTAIFGVLPAIVSARTDLRSSLGEGGRGGNGGPRKQRLRWALVATETALAALLTVFAVSTVRSFLALDAVDTGFERSGVVTLRPEPRGGEWSERERLLGFYDRAIETVASTPGIATAGAISRLPIANQGSYQKLEIEGFDREGDVPPIYWRAVAGEYFDAMGIAFRSGRAFQATDGTDAPLVGIINQATAETFWPGEDAVGRRLRTNVEDGEWLTVVGVVADVRHEDVRETSPFTLYRPLAQAPSWITRMALVARTQTTDDPQRAAGAALPRLREALRQMEPRVPVHQMATLDQVVSRSIARERLTGTVVAIYGSLAILLAAVGIFGLLSFSVGERRREIGIRMALGAQRESILRRVVAEGMGPVAVGAVLGLLAALLSGGLLEGFLYGVEPNDPATHAVVATVLLTVALAACWLPARSAASLEPISVLRDE